MFDQRSYREQLPRLAVIQILHQTRGGAHRRSHEGIPAADTWPGARGFWRYQVMAQ